MKKNLIKFLITVSILLTTFNANILAQSKISGEKLEKLLLENHVIIYIVYAGGNGFEINFNKDKTYKSTSGTSNSYTYKHPSSGTWEIVGFGRSNVLLKDIHIEPIQLLFGDDGNIYDLKRKLYTYTLENKKERIENNARKIEEERKAEELRLKKIEEEKRQLAIKREQERIKAEQEKIKAEQIKKEQERIKLEFDEWIKKNEEERIKKEKQEQLYNNILFLIGIAIALSIFYYINKFHKDKAKNLYLKLKKSLSKIFKAFKIESFDKKIFDVKKLVLFLFGLIFFGFFTFYLTSSNMTANFSSNIISFSKKNELEACRDAWNWLQKKIDSLGYTQPGSNAYAKKYQYQVYQNVVAGYYRKAEERIQMLRLVGKEYTIDTNTINLCEMQKINLY